MVNQEHFDPGIDADLYVTQSYAVSEISAKQFYPAVALDHNGLPMVHLGTYPRQTRFILRSPSTTTEPKTILVRWRWQKSGEFCGTVDKMEHWWTQR